MNRHILKLAFFAVLFAFAAILLTPQANCSKPLNSGLHSLNFRKIQLFVGRMTHHDFVRRLSAHLFFVTVYLRQHLIECKEARL